MARLPVGRRQELEGHASRLGSRRLLGRSARLQGGLRFQPGRQGRQGLCPPGADDLRVTQIEVLTSLLAKWLEGCGVPPARGSGLSKDSAFELIRGAEVIMRSRGRDFWEAGRCFLCVRVRCRTELDVMEKPQGDGPSRGRGPGSGKPLGSCKHRCTTIRGGSGEGLGGCRHCARKEGQLGP